MKKILCTVFLSFTLLVKAFAQQYPYSAEIAAFKKLDAANPPTGNEILFIGSSSFTYWTDVQNYFPDKKIINRGFGGSTILNQIHYAKDVALAFKPKQIVIYCGENDIAESQTVTAKAVQERFKQLFMLIRSKWPTMPIVYVSMKPSPSRTSMMGKFAAANIGIQKFLRRQPNTSFVDIFHLMLDASGNPRPELFKSDMLHMLPAGYEIWQKAIAPVLL